MKKLSKIHFYLVLIMISIFGFSQPVYATEDTELDELIEETNNTRILEPRIGYDENFANYAAEYSATIYGTSNGLPSLEITAIEQTQDGYIWVGSYAGLSVFDGIKFNASSVDSRIKNVTSLYCDRLGRLWIGTNDLGVARYNPKTGEVVIFNTKHGLGTNAIRTIKGDRVGNVYIGSTGYLSVVKEDDSVVRLSNYDITCVTDITVAEDNTIAGRTNDGMIFFMKDMKLIDTFYYDGQDGNYYTSICSYGEDKFLIGTSSNKMQLYSLEKNKMLGKPMEIQGLNDIQSMYLDKETNDVFVCCSNGFGYLDTEYHFTNMNVENFNNNSISQAVKDRQGNYWLASDKQGIMKLSKNPFINIFEYAKLDNHVVNAVALRDNELFIACDDGLLVLDQDTYVPKEYDIVDLLDGVRIRDVVTDSKNNVWICSYGEGGLYCLSENGISSFSEKDGAIGSRFRAVLELKDGSILASTNIGVNYFKDGELVKTLGVKDGLKSSQILCMVERADGIVYAGSDGNGIYVIKDGRVIDNISVKDGLESQVVLRIVACEDGFLYVTSNGIYYDNNGHISLLSAFPYSNNYDVYMTRNGQAWIGGSAGIYITEAEDLLANGRYNSMLLNNVRGFDTTLTANSWTYVDEQENYYLCCSTGVRRISVPEFNQQNQDYDITLMRLTADGEAVVANEDGSYTLPMDSNRIAFTPAVLNYTLSNPLVHMYVAGLDEQGTTEYQNAVKDLTFTNLPYGDYEFHMEILDERTKTVKQEKVILFHKDSHFYEQTSFNAYLVFVIVLAIVIFTWLLSKASSNNVIHRQFEEIAKAKDEADFANEAKTQFLANMSHEIRTPINTIMGMDELILREQLPNHVYQYAYDIKNASNSLLAIVNDILDLSKIESGKMNLVEQEYITANMLKDLSEMLQVKAEEKKLKAKIEISSQIPSKLYGDEVRIKQIILNLLSNAVKYTDKGTVTFRVSFEKLRYVEEARSGKKEKKKLFRAKKEEAAVPVVTSLKDHILLKVEVKDTGIGIHPEDMDKLFQSFERLDERKNSKIQGTGLGLVITKQLLELMGSKLEVESEYGRGSVFYFNLSQMVMDETPIGNISTREIEKTEYIPLFAAPEANVLVIDDTKMNIEVVKGLLRSTKVQVDTGISGKECLSLIKKKHYDLILLDHMMPEMDGIETFQRMKNPNMQHLCKDTPVIMLTANAIQGAREKYLEVGFQDYLFKPVNGKLLEETLYKYLPKEKIRIAEKEEKVEVEVNKYASLVNIDSAIGLEYSMNDEELYESILQMFVDEYEEKLQNIMSAYYEHREKDYVTYVHALKSGSKTIGAMDLFERAKELEMAGRESNWDIIHAKNENVMILYKEIVDEVAAFFK